MKGIYKLQQITYQRATSFQVPSAQPTVEVALIFVYNKAYLQEITWQPGAFN
jgi:hypothetical protein